MFGIVKKMTVAADQHRKELIESLLEDFVHHVYIGSKPVSSLDITIQHGSGRSRGTLHFQSFLWWNVADRRDF